MPNHETNGRDVAFAKFFERGSRAIKHSGWLNTLIVGNNNVPDGWRYHPEHPATYGDENWLTVKGDKSLLTLLPIPHLYPTAITFSVDREEMEAARGDDPTARDALALRWDTAMSVGELAADLRYTPLPGDQTRLQGSTLVGRGDFAILPGIVVGDISRGAAEFIGVPARLGMRDEKRFRPASIPLF